MDPRDSGIFRLASVGSYLDALSAITDEMSLKERSNLIFLDRCLHELWGLGQNVILNWCPEGDGIALLVIPHYGVAAYSMQAQVARRGTRCRCGYGKAQAGFLPSALVGAPVPNRRANGQGVAAARRRLDAHRAAGASEEHAGAERNHREDGQALQHHLRAESRRVRYSTS